MGMCKAVHAGADAGADVEVAVEVDVEALASDERLERMERVAMLHAEITAATRSFLSALAESDRHRDWAAEGFGSCAEWLAWRLGIRRNAANERVRAARALEHLPLISDAMARGELSFSKVRALTRVATPDSEAELLTFARAGSAENLERLVRGWRSLLLDAEGEARLERRQHARRSFAVFPDEQGMYVVRGVLPPEIGAVLMRAVDGACDALYREVRGVERADARAAAGAAATGAGPGAAPDGTWSDLLEDDDAESRREAARRRADAIGLIAERALAAGFGPGDDAPVSGSRAGRYQVMLHVQADALAEEAVATKLAEEAPTHARRGGRAERSAAADGAPAPADSRARPHLDDGTPVTAVTARRLACDAGRVVVRHDIDGSVLDVGRRTRTVPPALRRALEVRDRGCRFPGCGSRFTDAHHIVHWADGGETRLGNLVLLCRRHHRSVHEGRVRVCLDRLAQVVFFTPDGRTLGEAPPLPAIGGDAAEARPERDARGRPDSATAEAAAPPDPSAPLIRRNRARGVTPPPYAGQPSWSSDHHIPWAVEAAAREALDPWESAPYP